MKIRALVPVVLSAALVLAGCSATTTSDGADSAPSGEGATTLAHPSIDGLTIDFAGTPEKVVMDCYAYSSMHDYGITPVALFGFDCDNPNVMGDIDTSGFEFVGTDGEINMEKVAELRPDAIIGNGSADGWSWFGEDVNAQLKRVAPFVPLPAGDDVDGDIADTREIAAFFGGDTTSDAVRAADSDLTAAKEAVSAAAEGKDLDVMLASPTKEMLYSAVGFKQATLLEELGLTIIGAPKPEQGNPWGKIAWEEASAYPADVILVESWNAKDPGQNFTAELWDDLPAVRDKQVSGWNSKGALTARAYAAWLDDVAALVADAKKLS